MAGNAGMDAAEAYRREEAGAPGRRKYQIRRREVRK
jgi:hypothetical protein